MTTGRIAAAALLGVLVLSLSCAELNPVVLEETSHRFSEDDLSLVAAQDADVLRRRLRGLGMRHARVTAKGNEIIVSVPEGADSRALLTAIASQGLLAFQLVADERTTYDALKAMDTNLGDGLGQSGAATSFISHIQTVRGDFGVDEADYQEVRSLLMNNREFWPEDHEYLFGQVEVYEGQVVRRLYLLKSEPEMYGSAVRDVRPAPYRGSDPSLKNTWVVSLKFERDDAEAFAQVTGRNIGRRLAIVLDCVVKSAPVIVSRIPPDAGVIVTTTYVDPDRARDLAVILRSGALLGTWAMDTESYQ